MDTVPREICKHAPGRVVTAENFTRTVFAAWNARGYTLNPGAYPRCKYYSDYKLEKYLRRFNNMKRELSMSNLCKVQMALGQICAGKPWPETEFIKEVREEARRLKCKPCKVAKYKEWAEGPDEPAPSWPQGN